MRGLRAMALALAACLWLTLAGCGNKGPLVPPDEDRAERDKKRENRTY